MGGTAAAQLVVLNDGAAAQYQILEGIGVVMSSAGTAMEKAQMARC